MIFLKPISVIVVISKFHSYSYFSWGKIGFSLKIFVRKGCEVYHHFESWSLQFEDKDITYKE